MEEKRLIVKVPVSNNHKALQEFLNDPEAVAKHTKKMNNLIKKSAALLRGEAKSK